MKLSAGDLTRVALFASLISIASIVLKIGGDVMVPFSMLPFMAMLAGALLGPRLGALSVAVYLLIGLLGVPVFAKPPYGGLAYVLQPSFGFLPGFIVMAYVIGRIMDNSAPASILKYMGAMSVGIVAMYLVGLPYLYLIVKVYMGSPFTMWKAVQIGMLPFIGLDLIKGFLAALVARGVQRRLSAQATQGYGQK